MLAKLAISAMFVSFGFLGVIGFFIQQAGFFVVDFHNKVTQDRVYIPVPMILANTAVQLLPDNPKQQFQMQVGSHPEIFQALRAELLSYPDGPFLEVEKPGEKFSIVKKGRNLLIDMNSAKEEVHLQIPIASSMHVLAELSE